MRDQKSVMRITAAPKKVAGFALSLIEKVLPHEIAASREDAPIA